MADPAKVAKPRLGRGLSSLISSSRADAVVEAATVVEPSAGQYVAQTPEIAQDAVRELEIDKISPNPYQPRRQFDPEELANLSQSIAQQGVLQPLVVVKSADSSSLPFVLIAGERRLRAAKQAGLVKVPCVVRSATRQQMLEWAIIENIQRADLNAIERALAYRDYMDRFSLSAADAATKLAQPRTTVANHLRLLDLCDDLQKMVLENKLSFGHAKVLAGLAGDVDRQLAAAKRVIQDNLSVRQLELIVAAPAQSAAPAPTEKPARMKAAYLRDLEDQLTRAVGTRVAILPGKAKHTGRLVVEYYSLDDFDRIAKSLGVTVES